MNLTENEKNILREIKQKYYDVDLLIDMLSDEGTIDIMNERKDYNLIDCSCNGLTVVRELLKPNKSGC